jgi:hypothetical protein
MRAMGDGSDDSDESDERVFTGSGGGMGVCVWGLCLVCRLLQVVILVCAIFVVTSSALVNLLLDHPILPYSACLCASLPPSYLADEVHRSHVDHECKLYRCSRDIISLRNRPPPIRASSRRVQRTQNPRCPLPTSLAILP